MRGLYRVIGINPTIKCLGSPDEESTALLIGVQVGQPSSVVIKANLVHDLPSLIVSLHIQCSY